jgi:hypothetical protein
MKILLEILNAIGRRPVSCFMMDTASFAWARLPSRREALVDVLRGLALVCIFVDHIPADLLNAFTLRNFGFSDAAELFVLLAGFASMSAYGRSFVRDGALVGLRKIAMRCLRLYFFQIGMLLSMLLIVWMWTSYYNLAPRALAPMLQGGVKGVAPGLTLAAQPSNLNILPLYILLLSLFPLLFLGMRYSVKLTIGLSGALWLAVNLDPRLNLINAFDNQGWFFDPFAWQFLFMLGAGMALVMHQRGGVLPRWPWLIALCWAYVILAFLEVFPWQNWGLPDLALIQMAPPDKTALAPARLLHVLALVYIVLTSTGLRTALRWRVTGWLEACGRHSLEVFSLGTMLELCGRLATRTYGADLPMQIAINIIGLGGMIGLASALERGRGKPSRALAKVASQANSAF